MKKGNIRIEIFPCHSWEINNKISEWSNLPYVEIIDIKVEKRQLGFFSSITEPDYELIITYRENW